MFSINYAAEKYFSLSKTALKTWHCSLRTRGGRPWQPMNQANCNCYLDMEKKWHVRSSKLSLSRTKLPVATARQATRALSSGCWSISS